MYKQYKQFCWQSILLSEQLSSEADHRGVRSGFLAGAREGRLASAAPQRLCRRGHRGCRSVISAVRAGSVCSARHLAPSAPPWALPGRNGRQPVTFLILESDHITSTII